ncbi:MAG: hypothetical protein ACJ8H8_05300 [Geminicoccaceae bacterium]
MTGQRVWIAQLMCPKRHTIVASAAVAADRRKAIPAVVEPLHEEADRLVRSGAINAWCDLCGAPRETWMVDLGRTEFRTLEEAKPKLLLMQEENLRAQAVWDGHPVLGKTDEPDL